MKKLLTILLVIVVIAAGGLIAFLMSFDVNQYKEEIVSAVESNTGRSFQINGDLAMKVSLIPTISVEGVALGNAKWARDKHLVQVGQFEAKAALLPLLQKQIVIKKLILSDAIVNLESNADGKGNWEMGGKEQKTQDNGDSSLPDAVVESVALRNVTINYRDPAKKEPTRIALDKIDMNTSAMDAPLSVGIRASLDALDIALDGQLGAVTTLLDDEKYLVQLAGQIGDLDLSIDGTIDNPLRGAGINLKLDASAADLAALGKLADTELPAIAPVKISANINDARGTVSLNKMTAQLGNSDLSGDLTFTAMAPRSKIQANLKSERLDLTELLPASEEPVEAAKADRMFSEDPLPLDGLKAIDADIKLQAASLKSSAMEVNDFSTHLQLNAGKLNIPTLTAGVAGGKLSGSVMLDGGAKIPSLSHKLTITGMTLGRLPGLADKNLIEGGVTDVDIALEGRGASMAQIMGSANGKLLVKVGEGVLTNEAVKAGSMDMLLNALKMLNPMSSKSDATTLECAVINLPISNGVASNDTGIALLTKQLSVIGGGKIELGTEKIDIGAKPKPREGVGLNVAGLTDFMRIGGTLSNPKAVTDAKGAAVGAAKIGAAVATGGLSVLAEGLLDRSTADEDVCAVALGTKTASTQKKETPKTDNALKETATKATESVKNVFKGLFD